MTPVLPASSSIILPTVMRDGKPWGFMIRSGFIPLSLNGRSTAGWISPHTPFCPWRLENLSPSSGARVSRIRTLMSHWSSLSVVMTTWAREDGDCGLAPPEAAHAFGGRGAGSGAHGAGRGGRGGFSTPGEGGRG